MKVELSEALWVAVIEQLSEGSIKKCFGPLQEITRQLNEQKQAQANGGAPGMNNVDTSDRILG